jgi:hypothetical protein
MSVGIVTGTAKPCLYSAAMGNSSIWPTTSAITCESEPPIVVQHELSPDNLCKVLCNTASSFLDSASSHARRCNRSPCHTRLWICCPIQRPTPQRDTAYGAQRTSTADS